MAKSLFSALTGRSRADASIKHKAGSSNHAANAAQSSQANRRHRFDDKSGPPPPRGSLTSEKLSYLDWRLKRINNLRQKSEGTSCCWIDGRDTIGRCSLDVARPAREESIVPVPVTVQVPQAPSRMPMTMAAVYEEKAAGLKALQLAYANDSVLASMPKLAKRDSSSGSEMSGSGSSDQHSSDTQVPAVLHATTDKDVGNYYSKPRRSFLARAGPRSSNKKVESAAEESPEARQARRNNRLLARMFIRSR